MKPEQVAQARDALRRRLETLNTVNGDAMTQDEVHALRAELRAMLAQAARLSESEGNLE